MAKTFGHVRNIAVNPHKVSFLLDPPGDKPPARFVLFDDPPDTHTIPQVQLAHRSWMVALLQTAFVHEKFVVATHDDDNLVRQIDLGISLDLGIDFTDEEAEKDSSQKPKKPGPFQKDTPSPPGPGKRPNR